MVVTLQLSSACWENGSRHQARRTLLLGFDEELVKVSEPIAGGAKLLADLIPSKLSTCSPHTHTHTTQPCVSCYLWAAGRISCWEELTACFIKHDPDIRSSPEQKRKQIMTFAKQSRILELSIRDCSPSLPVQIVAQRCTRFGKLTHIRAILWSAWNSIARNMPRIWPGFLYIQFQRCTSDHFASKCDIETPS